MSTENTSKTRQMTPKWFLSLANRSGTKSAANFLASHRNWLENSVLAAEVAPILAQIDSKELYPTPGLEAILHVALAHIMSKDLTKANKQLNSSVELKTTKPYVAVIMTLEGEVASVLDDKKESKYLRASFDHLQEADRWCQRRLNEGAVGWYGEITWTKVIAKSGIPMVTRVERNDAIRLLSPRSKTPFMHYNKVGGGGRLSNRMSVGQTHVRFSRG